jgi:hypothetical protein
MDEFPNSTMCGRRLHVRLDRWAERVSCSHRGSVCDFRFRPAADAHQRPPPALLQAAVGLCLRGGAPDDLHEEVRRLRKTRDETTPVDADEAFRVDVVLRVGDPLESHQHRPLIRRVAVATNK